MLKKKKNEFNNDQPVICSFSSKFHILLKKKNLASYASVYTQNNFFR